MPLRSFFRTFVRRLLGRLRSSRLPFVRRLFVGARASYRLVGRMFPFLHLGWVAVTSRVRWDDGSLVVEGWAYTRGTGYAATPQIEVWLQRRWSRRRHLAAVTPVVDVDVRGTARRAEHDYANTAFRARWDDSVLRALADEKTTGSWQVRVQVTGSGRRYWGRLRTRRTTGSAAVMALRLVDEHTAHGPAWQDGRGLVVVRQEVMVLAGEVALDARTLTVQLPRPVTSARLVGDGQVEAVLQVVASGGGCALVGEVPARTPWFHPESGRLLPSSWTLLVTVDGHEHPVRLRNDVALRPTQVSPLYVRPDALLALTVIDVPTFVEVVTATLDPAGTALALEGRLMGPVDDLRLTLVASRSRIPVTALEVADGRFTAVASLRQGEWGGPELPAKRGAYTLLASDASGTFSTFVDPSLTSALPIVHSFPEYRLRLELERRDQLRLSIGRPRQADEYGSYHQTQLMHEITQGPATLQESVFFESFFGRNATCNPRAVDHEIARRHPDLPRYWAVDDLSIAVPEGATAVVIGTREWWTARNRSRWVVTNEWLRTRFVKRPGQVVLQTWHGSMYKKIGLDRDKDRRHEEVLRRDRLAWDMFVSQSAPTTEIIKRAYDFPDGVIEAGYPRNDELHQVDAALVADIRARLGLADGQKVAMYAPTWREAVQDETEIPFLDLPQLVQDLGEGWTVLQRGHVRTLGRSDAIEAEGVLDVGTYPQVSELFMVADVLITDYSSMMFDYSVTGKPMIFFVPDIDQYTDEKVRGAYFDLEELAPGPVVRTQPEVLDLLAGGLGWVEGYADKYTAWQQRFNHLDDGGASARVVDALFAKQAPVS